MKRRGFFGSVFGLASAGLASAAPSVETKPEPEVLKKDDLVKFVPYNVHTNAPYPCGAYSFGVHLDKPCDCITNFTRKM